MNDTPSPEIVVIVTGIEGTTSDTAFVQEVLCPYARERLPAWVRTQADDTGIAALLDDVRTEAHEPEAGTERTLELLEDWMAHDIKSTPLKTLQLMVWRSGYESGDFTGHVYADAVAGLQAWADDHRALCVYSSDTVDAQKLWFTHSDHGDLSGLFSGYFDTRMGPKKKSGSYAAIANELGEAPRNLLFLSSVGDELDAAAAAAGWQTCWIARDDITEENARMNAAHPMVRSFDEIEII